jgi:hypothetical protein
VEPLTPELALVDPELARVARDQLPVSGEAQLLTPAATSSAREAPPRLEDTGTDREQPPPRRSRRGRRVLLGAVVVLVAMAAIYAWAPASTVRDELSSRKAKTPSAPTHQKSTSKAPANRTKRPAGVGAAKVPGHATSSPTGVKQTSSKSTSSSTYQTRIFIWPAVPRASFYKVEFLRKGTRVFEALTSRPRLELPLRWVYRGRSFRLLAGVYSWRVLPAFGPRARLRYGDPIIRSTWTARLR